MLQWNKFFERDVIFMGKNSQYYEQKYRKEKQRLEVMKLQLPKCAIDVLEYKEQSVQTSTLISYCYDLRTFFRYYLTLESAKVDNIKDITAKDLEAIAPKDLIAYQRYLEFNEVGEYHKNTKKSIARKVTTLRTLYKYHFENGNIDVNPMLKVPMPKLKKDKAITRMTPTEITLMLKAVSRTSGIKKGRAFTFKKKTRQRDMAIITLLLNTGIRVSECVGLDLSDVDTRDCSLTVVRKGGAQDIVFFNKDVKKVLQAYLRGERKNAKVVPGHEQAFFLSLQGRRISVDSIERTVRAFSRKTVPNKHITPHKLRSTYGTELYKKTGDIRLVKECLGHDNIQTTIRYYAAFDDDYKRKAAKSINFTLNAKNKNGENESDKEV